MGSTTTSTMDSPTIKQRRVKPTVQLNDGAGAHVGGLIQDQVNDTRNQIPVLGDIPLIGSAFKEKKSGTIGKTELIVSFTPRVMRGLNEAREITDEYSRKFVSPYASLARHTAIGGTTIEDRELIGNQDMQTLADLSSGTVAGAEQAEDFAEAFGQRLIEANLLDTGSLDRARRVRHDRRAVRSCAGKASLVPEGGPSGGLGIPSAQRVATARGMPAAPVLPGTIRRKSIRSREVLPLAAENGHLAVQRLDPFDDEPLDALADDPTNVSMLLIRRAISPTPSQTSTVSEDRRAKIASTHNSRSQARRMSNGCATSPTRRHSSALSTRSSLTP